MGYSLGFLIFTFVLYKIYTITLIWYTHICENEFQKLLPVYFLLLGYLSVWTHLFVFQNNWDSLYLIH